MSRRPGDLVLLLAAGGTLTTPTSRRRPRLLLGLAFGAAIASMVRVVVLA